MEIQDQAPHVPSVKRRVLLLLIPALLLAAGFAPMGLSEIIPMPFMHSADIDPGAFVGMFAVCFMAAAMWAVILRPSKLFYSLLTFFTLLALVNLAGCVHGAGSSGALK